MRKGLSLLLCIILVVTMIPGMAFAEEPGTLYWSGVPNNVTDGSILPTGIEWYGADGMPIGFNNDAVRRVYLGVKDAQGNIQPISTELESLKCGSNISVTDADGYIYTLTAQEVNAQTWIRYSALEQNFEVGIDIALGNEGSGQPPAGNLSGTLYWAEADKVTGNVTQNDLDNSEIWHTELTPQAGISLNVIFAIKEGAAVVFVNDPATIKSGNENVVKVSGGDGNVLTLEFKEAGSSWLCATLDSGDYKLDVDVAEEQGSESASNQLYFIYAGSNVKLREGSNILLINEVAYEGDRDATSAVIDQYGKSAISSQLRGHSGYFVVKDNATLLAVGGVESSDSNIVDIRNNDDGSQEIRIKNPGTVTLSRTDGEKTWTMKVTGTISGLNIRAGGWTTGPGNGIGNGIFLNQMEVYDGNTRLTAEQYGVKLSEETKDNGTIEITPDNTIKFVPTAAGQTTMVITYKGENYNFVFNVYENDIGQGGGNQGGEGPETFDIFVLSSRDDLASLTEQDIMNELDFAIIEASLTHEERKFTGYPYVATKQRLENGNWVYAGFRELYDSENLFVDYSTSSGAWVNSLDGDNAVKDFSWTENSNGTYTFTYAGPKGDHVGAYEEESGNTTYGYSVGVYKPTPDGGIDSNYCRCMPFQFAFLETAPVGDNGYDMSVELLLDPSEIEGFPYEKDRMVVNGQGPGMVFNSKITSWYTCFYVRNQQNDYDARYIKTVDTNEIRTYVGGEGDYVIEGRARNNEEWVPISTLDSKFQVFSIEYIGAKKGFYPVFMVKFDVEKDDTNEVTNHYEFRLRYTAEDQYLDNGNKNNYRCINLHRDEDLAEFDIDEYWFNEVYQDWNTGNVLHFDYIGTSFKTKLNIRPGVLQSVADKKWIDRNNYIFIEDEVRNIRFYRYEETPDGNWERIELAEEQCPFTVTWNEEEKVYNIAYNHPERDLYGPHYEMSYIGDYNSKINEAYGYEPGTEHLVANASGMITPKLTVHIGEVGQDGSINATTEDKVNGTEVIIGDGAVSDNLAQLVINTNDGTITLSDDLVGEIKKNGKVHLKMWDVLDEIYFVKDKEKQEEEVKKCVQAFDFKLDGENGEGIDFGENGYATIKVPYSGDYGYIYFINDEGEKEYIDCEIKDGFIIFNARHFSVYGISMEAPAQGDDNTGDGGNQGGSTGGIGGGALPSKPSDNVTNDKGSTSEAPSTNADMSQSTTMKGDETTTTVDQTTADRIVDKAVENSSEEIVIDATYKTPQAAHSTKAAEVAIPTETMEAIADKTEADVTIKTDVAEIKLDNQAAEAIADQAEGETLSIVAVKTNESAKEVRFELKVVCSEGKVISDFKGGNVSITVNIPNALKGKKLVCVYFDKNGHAKEVEGYMDGDKFVFTTGHFSTYALMTEEDAAAAIAKTEKIKAGVEKTTIKLKSTLTRKGNVKLTWTKSRGYKVDYYEVFRSIKRNSGYGKKPFYVTATGSKTTYTNTKQLKAGKTYYYKVRGVREIAGEKVYTQYSNKAWRTIK